MPILVINSDGKAICGLDVIEPPGQDRTSPMGQCGNDIFKCEKSPHLTGHHLSATGNHLGRIGLCMGEVGVEVRRCIWL